MRVKSYNFSYTGTVQNLTIPSRCIGIYIEAYGAQGAYLGGKGGSVSGTYIFKPNDSRVLNIYVGGSNGYNGGAGGGYNGGGATDIRLNGAALTNRIMVAAGGGGGSNRGYNGGAGGGLVGGIGGYESGNPAFAGKGGTQTAGGAGGYGVGSLGQGGVGLTTEGGWISGGGGGGYYGGGGGTCNQVNRNTLGVSAGGGGSSYIDALESDAITIAGVNAGNGSIKITLIALDKLLLKKDSQYYSILPQFYDSTLHQYLPLTLEGGTIPNLNDINKYGFDNIDQLITSITKESDTFLPIDKLKVLGGVFDLKYYYYNV